MRIEYRVRPVVRYVVTRWHQNDDSAPAGGVETKGEYASQQAAYDVGYALCKHEHEQLGYPPGDDRVVYPVLVPIGEADLVRDVPIS